MRRTRSTMLASVRFGSRAWSASSDTERRLAASKSCWASSTAERTPDARRLDADMTRSTMSTMPPIKNSPKQRPSGCPVAGPEYVGPEPEYVGLDVDPPDPLDG